MRHKPMLLHKIIGKSMRQTREVIGIIGTHHGVGATYTAMMLAFFMGEERGRKTAFLEYNEHHDMSIIQSCYEWSEEDKDSFSFHNITCYKEVTRSKLMEVFGQSYDCIIIDFGTNFLDNKEELLRCSTKIIVGGRSEWDHQKLLRFLQRTGRISCDEQWLYFIPQANEKSIYYIKSLIQKHVWALPTSENPTEPSRHICRLFHHLFPD